MSAAGARQWPGTPPDWWRGNRRVGLGSRPVRRARLHARAGPGHHVVSPLGAWMVVAVCAALARDEQDRRELADYAALASAAYATHLT